MRERETFWLMVGLIGLALCCGLAAAFAPAPWLERVIYAVAVLAAVGAYCTFVPLIGQVMHHALGDEHDDEGGNDVRIPAAPVVPAPDRQPATVLGWPADVGPVSPVWVDESWYPATRTEAGADARRI